MAHDAGAVDRLGSVGNQAYVDIDIAHSREDSSDERHFIGIAVDDLFLVDCDVFAALRRKQSSSQFRGGAAQDNDLRTRLRQQHRPDVHMRFAIAAGRLDAENEERRRQGIRLGGRRRGDSGELHAFGRPAGARVQDVAKLTAIVDEVLDGGCRDAKCSVAQVQDGAAAAGLVGVEQSDGPAAA
jgi:hypothetical protein